MSLCDHCWMHPQERLGNTVYYLCCHCGRRLEAVASMERPSETEGGME